MNKENKFLRFLKSFNLYELIWLGTVIVLVTLSMIFLKEEVFEDSSTMLTMVCSIIAIIANPICELMISKQNKYNFLVSIAFIEVTETIIYMSLHLYSCAFVSLLFWIPIDIYSFIKWNKHKDEKDEDITKVKKLNWWQDILIILGIATFSFVVGWLLSILPECEDSYLDAFVSALGMANGVLLLLRYNEQWYAWFTYLIFDAILWIISGHYIMLITVIAMMINTIYGFIKWLKYIKNKSKNESKIE